MATIGTWIVARGDEPLSKTRAVQGLPLVRGGEVDDLATAPGWSAARTEEAPGPAWARGECDVASLVAFVEQLAAELDAPVVAGWSEDGDALAGCFSGNEAAPLLFAINLDEQTAEASGWGEDFLAELTERWGTPWEDEAAVAIAEWLARIDAEVDETDVREVFEDEFAVAPEGLLALVELAGFRKQRPG